MQRRDFIRMTPALPLAGARSQIRPSPKRPVVIASRNGSRAVERAMEILRQRGSCLDAVIAGVRIVEDDPEDSSVGYGGLPNEEGTVELDACVMDGLSCRAGAVGALQSIRNPSRVARLVMERTDHIFLVGRGAKEFALKMGFLEENLLTEKSRRQWLEWKSKLSDRDNWLREELEETPVGQVLRHHGTINCLAVDEQGNLAGTTTTSGLPWKIPGRVGDSPIIGAGLFVDNEVGAAGSTGRGEANIKVCGGHTVVELMRRGRHPEQACLETLERVVRTTREARLRGGDGRPNFNLNFYALNKQGEYGAAALYPSKFTLHDGDKSRILDSAHLFERP